VLAAIVLGALALVEIAPFAAPVVALEPSPTLKRLAAEADDDAVLDIPFRYAMQRYILDQTLHRRPLVNGYMIRFTPRYVAHPSDVPGFELMRDPETLPKDCDGLRLAFALTRLLGVRYIVLHKRYVSGRAVPNLLASGLPLERVDEDAQVILFRLDRARILAADASSFDAGAAESSGRRLTLGFSPGGVWPNGRQFLWSEETESAIALAPPAGTRNVNVELLAYEAAAAGRPVQAIVTTSDSSQQVALTGGWTEVRIPVPANQTDPLILRFRTPSCARPADIEPRSADKRCLALGLARIAWTR
jgi:hypothetical protein